jgi:hypothetical protein
MSEFWCQVQQLRRSFWFEIFRLLASWYLLVRPRETARHPLDGFVWNLEFAGFSKICRENSSFFKILTRTTSTLHEGLCTVVIIFRRFLPRMRTVSEKVVRANQNLRFMYSNCFRKSCCLGDNVEKCGKGRGATDDGYNTAQKRCDLHAG